MFTGIVQALGTVRGIAPGPNATRLEVGFGDWSHRPEPGASIAVNGCCLTVVATAERAVGVAGARELVASFDAIPQTMRVTALGALAVGSRVNLEHAATAATFLGGHLVQGHVDGIAEVVEVRTAGEWRVRVRLPAEFGRYLVDKGSIALDGVSLTIAAVEPSPAGEVVDVCLIPETLARTTLGALAPGARIHFEVDHFAKLVARQFDLLASRAPRG